MDLSKTISYTYISSGTSTATLQLNTRTETAGGIPASGYLVDQVNVSDIEVAAYAEKRALQDGVDASDVYLGRRRIAMIVSVYGSTRGDFWDKTQDLLAAFSPTIAYTADSANLGFLPLDFYQPTADIVTWPTSAYPNGIPLRYYARPSLIPTYEINRDTDGGTAGIGLTKKFRVSLVCRDPRKYAQTETTSQTTTLTNNGDYPTIPRFVYISATSATGTWIGTLNGASWTVNVDGSRFTAAQAATYNRWALDPAGGILYGPTTTGLTDGNRYFPGGDSNFTNIVKRMDRLQSGSTFPDIAPGANTLTVGGTLAPTTHTAWRDAFA